MTLLKKYDTAEEMKAAMFRIKESDDTKDGTFSRIDFQFRHIDYVRYADDFLVGIVGSKEFVIKIRSQMDQFVKGDLHLGIKKNDIVSRNEGAVKFLEFAIYLRRFCNSVRVKSKSIATAQKYKQRVVSRLRHNNAKLANRQVNLIKSNLLSTYRKIVEKLGLNSDKINYRQVSTYLVLKFIKDELVMSQTFNYQFMTNEAMKR